MMRGKIAARICAFTLAVSLIAVDALPAFAAAVPEEMTADGMQIMEGETADEKMDSNEAAEAEALEGTGEKAEGEDPEGTEEAEGEAEAEPEETGEGEAEPKEQEKIEEEAGAEAEPKEQEKIEEEAGAEAEPKEPEGVEDEAAEPNTPAGMRKGAVPALAAEPGEQETDDGRIRVDGVLYNGYYLDSAGILYLVSDGAAEEKNGTVKAGTEYYSQKDGTKQILPANTVYVGGKIYTGYYLDSKDRMRYVKKGTSTPKTGTVKAKTKYYSYNAGKTETLKKDTFYVKGKVYTGYYLDSKGKMHYVKKGTRTPKTGTMRAKTKYYSYNAGKTKTLKKDTFYVKGKVYTGYYLDSKGKMHYVKKGTRTPKTGTVKAKTKYYSYNAGKTKTLKKDTFYVKGKVYTGYYLDSKGKMHYVKKGTRTPKTGTVKAKTKYYSYNAGKTKTLKKDTFYVKGKVYTGYYLDSKGKMYHVKKGTRALFSGILKAKTKYYSYKEEKKLSLSKETVYVNGKVYTGYYTDKGNRIYSVTNGTRTLLNATLPAGTEYYNYNAGKMQKLSSLMVYVDGKAMEGMSAESLATLQRAQAVVLRITNDGMTKEQKLRTCFDFVKTYEESRPRMPHYRGMDWPVIYANDMFVNGTGNCFSYAAAFAYMAKAIGYEEVYCCHSGGHGWAEIDGLVYDPEWSMHHHVYNYYALSYDTQTDQDYKGAIGARKEWMRIKI